MRVKIIRILLVSIIIWGIFVSPALKNLWGLAIERAYFIPQESSVFTFTALVDNPGSGDWWLRGEDWFHFYAIHDEEPAYLVIPKSDLESCPQFSVNDLSTWCQPITKRIPLPSST